MRFDNEQFSDQRELDPEADFELAGEGLEIQESDFQMEAPTAPRTGAPSGSRPPARAVAARILWPALGFPAVIAPRPGAARNPADSDATRTICVLVLSNVQALTSQDAARYLRCVPWADRKRRTVRAGEPGSFAPAELTVRSGLVERGAEDNHGKALSFGGNRQQGSGITASLSKFVRGFYAKHGLKYLHEIRVSEAASARLAGDQFHLFWNKEVPDQSPHSNEVKFLLDHFVPGRLSAAPAQDRSFLLNGYKFEYGGLHQPYNQQERGEEPTEVLHPVFVRRNLKATLTIGHVTDTHIDVRNDVYARNLQRKPAEVRRVTAKPVAFNNWNESFTAVYNRAKSSDVILLTGDLIDYGRGHIGNADEKLGQDDQYHKDRNWLLFYYLLASKDKYRTPVYTILGNHDWRLNPYPPFAPSTPDPEEFLHNNNVFTREERKKLLQIAHGPRHERAYSYLLDVDKRFSELVQIAEAAVKAKRSDTWAALRGHLDIPRSPVYTTDDSIRWYLLAINPFLDYQFAVPSGHQFLMLDFAEDEEVGKEDTANGAVKTYGPRASKCLTALQQWHVEQFVRAPGRAKTIGIHVPPIGPRPNWFQTDLLEGKKTYRGGEDRRYPTPDFKATQIDEHPLLAVRPRPAPYGFAADYGSFVGKDRRGTDTREWFIKRIAAAGAGIRAVLSGHIHRQGLFVVFPGEIKLSGYSERFGSIPVLRVRRIPEPQAGNPGAAGPVYVNTTSAGPRGYQYFGVKQTRSEDPGFSVLELSNNGTIGRVRHVPVPHVSARAVSA